MLTDLNVFDIERFCDSVNLVKSCINNSTLNLRIIIWMYADHAGNFYLLQPSKLSCLLKLASQTIQDIFFIFHTPIVANFIKITNTLSN